MHSKELFSLSGNVGWEVAWCRWHSHILPVSTSRGSWGPRPLPGLEERGLHTRIKSHLFKPLGVSDPSHGGSPEEGAGRWVLGLAEPTQR